MVYFQKLVTPALGRSDMFSADDVGTLFGNIVELRSIHTKFFKEISVCQTVSSLTRVIERLLPPMSIAYNQYCSNFPRATALFGDINQKPNHAATPNRPVISKPISKTASLRRSIQQPDGSFEPNSIRSSISFRAKFSPLRPGPEKRDRPGTHSRGTGLIRRHTIIGRSSASINLDLQTPGFLRRTFSPRKSIKSCHEPVVTGFNQPVKTPVNRQSAFLENCMARSELDDQLPLIAYLLEPVQRVMRYPLLLKGLRYYLEISRSNSGKIENDKQIENDIISTDRAIQIAEKLAIITNITQPYQNSKKMEKTGPSGPTGPKMASAPTSPATSPVKSEKKRRSFEFMRQAAERLLRSR